MKRILVPTDFSEQAENALKVAAQLAKKSDGEIFLLHMLELPLELIDPVHGSSSHNLPESIFFMKLAHQRFAELMSKPFLKDVKIHETVQFHQAFEGIMEVSEERECDLIVMGSHGASGLKEMFIGSNTEKVVRTSKTPVLVIKHEHPVFEVEDFVYAMDVNSKNYNSLKEARNCADELDARLHILFINTPNNFLTTVDAHKKMQKCLDEARIEAYKTHVHNDVSVEKGILSFAADMDASLIGISTHGHKGLAHFFNGSISEDLVNHAQRPVITFKI